MSNVDKVTFQDWERSVEAINERIERADGFTGLFVDANILGSLIQNKNQIIYGRRGTGKTHLLGRLREFYRDSYDENKIIPVFVDGRVIANRPIGKEMSSSVILMIFYRRFLDAIISSLETLLEETVTLNIYERLWPSGGKRKKIAKVQEKIERIKRNVRFGQIEMGHGKASSEVAEKAKIGEVVQYGLDAKVALEVKQILDSKLSVEGKSGSSVSNDSEESLKVVYEGLTVINFDEVSQDLVDIIQELDARSLVVLFDEWSALDIDLQPIFAEMIRSTLIASRKLAIKFACIPFLTRMSTADKNGQTIGLPIGEEVFVDADLDKYYNPYLDTDSVMLFLLSVLKKHLGATLPQLQKVADQVSTEFLVDSLFVSAEAFRELVRSSAGVPRDFLRIFARSFRKTQGVLPIGLRQIRLATHEFFQEEKQGLVFQRATTFMLFEDIFDKICQTSSKYIFFVTQDVARNRILRELWHHRLIHLVFQGHIAYLGEKQGTYDVYAIDHGRYILMTNSKKGEEVYKRFHLLLSSLAERFPVSSRLRSAFENTPVQKGLMSKIKGLLPEVLPSPEDREMDVIFDDCGPLVADSIIKDLGV